MKSTDIQLGGHYTAKVSGKPTIVSVLDHLPENQGWVVKNLSTGRTCHFHGVGRFLSHVGEATEKPKSLRERLGAQDGACHVLIEARAGTGKTTTLVEGLKAIKGIDSPFTPSPQQEAIWELMIESTGRVNSICFAAFNRSIKDELAKRVPSGCDAKTMHSLGLKSITTLLPDHVRLNVQERHNQDVTARVLNRDILELRKTHFESLRATSDMVGHCKLSMLGFGPDGFSTDLITYKDFSSLARHHDIEMNGDALRVYDWAKQTLNGCLDIEEDYTVDYDDMIWIPLARNLQVAQYDALLLDEVQDLNRCQQALALRIIGETGRMFACGDTHQAIYGFAGADVEGIGRLFNVLLNTDRGCVRLPLTVTRRCGKAIVEEARKIVPDFEAHESNCDGAVYRANLEGPDGNVFPIITDGSPATISDDRKNTNYRVLVEDGDMVLCRVNAPLVEQCFKFIKEGRKANIQGRDIGAGLVKTIKKVMKGYSGSGDESITELHSRLQDWLAKETKRENNKKNPDENALIRLYDRFDCISCFVESQTSVDDVISAIEKLFTDKSTDGILFSSVHRAKGLEADRVFILLPENGQMPHPMAKSKWQIEQEMNLKYVAITRAIKELVYVT